MKPKRPKLDLHGYRVSEAEEAVLQFLSDSVLKGEKQIEIIHGHGTGKIKNIVKSVLQQSEIARSFKPHPENSGVVVVYLG